MLAFELAGVWTVLYMYLANVVHPRLETLAC